MPRTATTSPKAPLTINRRTLLSGSAGTMLLLGTSGLLAACGGKGSGESGSDKVKASMFVWVGSGQGDMPRAAVQQYTATNPNVQIEYVEGTNAETFPKLLTSLKVTPNDPIINFGFFNSAAIEQGKLQDIWLPLDPAQVPNIKAVMSDYRLPDDKGVYFSTSTVGLVYNTKVFQEKGWPPPTSWNDLWDPKFHGKVAFFDEPGFSWNGLVPTARLNGGSEKDIQPAIDIYAKAARDGQIQSLYTSPDQLKQLLVNEDAWISPYFFGITWPWTEGGAPVGYAVPTEGQIAFPLAFGLVKGSSDDQQKVGRAVINTMLSTEMVQQWCEATFAIPVVEGVKVTGKLSEQPAYQPDAIKNQMNLDWATMAKKNDEWVQLWNQQVKANLK